MAIPYNSNLRIFSSGDLSPCSGSSGSSSPRRTEHCAAQSLFDVICTSNSRPIGAVPSHNNPSNKGLGAPRSLAQRSRREFSPFAATERPKNSEFPEK